MQLQPHVTGWKPTRYPGSGTLVKQRKDVLNIALAGQPAVESSPMATACGNTTHC